jgi:hypothetical protein
MYHLAAFMLIENYIKVLQSLAWFCFRSGFTLACKGTNLLYERMSNIKVHNVVTPVSNIIGGGTSKMFTAAELHRFVNSPSTAEIFKFKSYSTLLEATELQYSNIALVSAYVPWGTLLPKLTVVELKAIAKCHEIATNSKSKSQEIQTALSNHTCDNCNLYVSIFEIFDDETEVAKKKASHVKAVNKNQVNTPEYKQYHLAAVKRVKLITLITSQPISMQ